MQQKNNKTQNFFYRGVQFFVFTLVSFFCLQGISKAQLEGNEIFSPNKELSAAVFLDEEGIPYYSISLKGKQVLEGALGVNRSDSDFSYELILDSISADQTITDSYTLLHGKKNKAIYNATKKVFYYKNNKGLNMHIIFQVSDDGVAFRYHFPETDVARLYKITDEMSYFNFDAEAKAWIQPLAEAKTGWNGVNPSYEEHYLQDVTVTKLPNNKPGWCFPALFYSAGAWIALTETAPERNYCGSRLVHDSSSTLFKVGFPMQAEVQGNGALTPESNLPWLTPWRIITIGETLATLVESTLGTDLAKPTMLNDISFVKPGISAWSWVLLKDDSTVYPVQKNFIDYASTMGWEYCLIDADWDRKIGYEKLKELCDYAAQKNVGVNVWYNSAGDWNTTPYTPRDKLLTKELRESEFRRLKEIGVKGIKVDFFGGDGQSVMNYYQDIIEDAGRYGLMVNCHGSTIPRGWHRTYPNLVSMESIRGFEFVTFEQINADLQANHSTVIPFTRNLFDPMDFTPVCFSEVPNMKRKTTNSFELALSVLFLSGIQHFAEIPAGMEKVNDEVKQILKDVPVLWDETKFIDGYPGKFVVVARRKGTDWYIAGINGDKNKKDVNIDLSFIIDRSSGLIITSATDRRSFKIEKTELTNNFVATLQESDGFLIRITGK